MFAFSIVRPDRFTFSSFAPVRLTSTNTACASEQLVNSAPSIRWLENFIRASLRAIDPRSLPRGWIALSRIAGGRPLPLLRTEGLELHWRASARLQTQACEMFDPAGRDDQAVHPGRVEHEAEGAAGHGLVARLGRLLQPFDRIQAIL